MTLHPQPLPAIPEETLRVARAAFPKENLYMRMRDVFGVFFRDEDFIDPYSRCGYAAEAPWRLALITVMQFVEGLTDRQAAEAVRSRIELTIIAEQLQLPLEKVQQIAFRLIVVGLVEEIPLIVSIPNATPEIEMSTPELTASTNKFVSQSFLKNLIGFLGSVK